MIGLIYFLLALGLIVVVHEFGHLIVAKRNGVYCHEFSVGMGPRIKHFHTDKTGTEYSLRAIPLGGYVRLAGEDDNKDDKELEPEQLLTNKSAWVKIKVLGAGSFMNLLLTLTIMTIIAFTFGVATEDNITHEYIMENLPNILTVAIGLTIDKKYSVSNVYQAYDFIIGEVKNDDWINEENIVNRRPILELPVYDNFDWRTFDTKTFIESFDKNKLLSDLYSLIPQK